MHCLGLKTTINLDPQIKTKGIINNLFPTHSIMAGGPPQLLSFSVNALIVVKHLFLTASLCRCSHFVTLCVVVVDFRLRCGLGEDVPTTVPLSVGNTETARSNKAPPLIHTGTKPKMGTTSTGSVNSPKLGCTS